MDAPLAHRLVKVVVFAIAHQLSHLAPRGAQEHSCPSLTCPDAPVLTCPAVEVPACPAAPPIGDGGVLPDPPDGIYLSDHAPQGDAAEDLCVISIGTLALAVGDKFLCQAGDKFTVHGPTVIVKRGARVGVLQFKADEAAADEEDLEDARVLPVKWRGSARRRGFAEAVAMMIHHDFGDWELEAAPTLDWLLQKMVSGGEGPISRHFTWLSNAGIPHGDRSVHEHFCIAKVFEAGAEVDQLNLPSLKSFELLAKRMQCIEAAHMHSPSNPDYSMSEDIMGWGPQRGAALVAPSTLKYASDKARDRAAILKEGRKLAEELKLRKSPLKAPKGPKGGHKGDSKGHGAEDA